MRPILLIGATAAAAFLALASIGGDVVFSHTLQQQPAQPTALITIVSPLQPSRLTTPQPGAGATGAAPPAAAHTAPAPVISVAPRQSAPGGILTVKGTNWPPHQEVHLTLSEFPDRDAVLNVDGEHYLTSTRADAEGRFQTDLRIPEGAAWYASTRALVVAFTADLALNAVEDVSLREVVPPSVASEGPAVTSPEPTPERVVAVVMVKGDSSAMRLPASSVMRSASSVSYPTAGASLVFPLILAVGAAGLVAAVSTWTVRKRIERSSQRLSVLEGKLDAVAQRVDGLREGLHDELNMIDATLKEAVANMNESKELLALKLDKFRRQDVVQKLERLEALERRQRLFWDGLDVFMDESSDRARVLREFADYLNRGEEREQTTEPDEDTY